MKYKPYRSYPAVIKKIENAKIYVIYDGYPDSGHWLKSEQWAERITILENDDDIYDTILPSVNIKSVETWDKNDFLQWIKTLQQKQFFECKNKDESATMNHIIRQQKYSGKELKHCNTQDSFMKLF
eukprot:212805_1